MGDNVSLTRISMVDFFKTIYHNKVKIIVISTITILLTVLNFNPVQSYKFVVDLYKSSEFNEGSYLTFKNSVGVYDSHIKTFLDQSKQKDLYIEVYTKERSGILTLDVISNSENTAIINSYIQYSIKVARERRMSELEQSRKLLQEKLDEITPKEIKLIEQIIEAVDRLEINSGQSNQAAQGLLGFYQTQFDRNSDAQNLKKKISKIDHNILRIKKAELMFQEIRISKPEHYGSASKLRILYGLIYGLVLSFIAIFLQFFIKEQKNKSSPNSGKG